MTHDNESELFGLEGPCSIHGDEDMQECSVCGAEFCRLCHPHSTVCPDCAEATEEELEDEELGEDEDLEDLFEEEEDEFEEEEETDEESEEEDEF